jgi:Helix-turn-helix domain
VSSAREEFWSVVPDEALHPVRVPVIEALWWIDEPLSPAATVDVLDGFLSTSEAVHHLRALRALGVVEPVPAPTDKATKRGLADVPYRLTER